MRNRFCKVAIFLYCVSMSTGPFVCQNLLKFLWKGSFHFNKWSWILENFRKSDNFRHKAVRLLHSSFCWQRFPCSLGRQLLARSLASSGLCTVCFVRAIYPYTFETTVGWFLSFDFTVVSEITSNAKYLCFHEAWLNHEHRIFLYPSELLWSLVHRLLSNPFNLVLILHYINNIPMNAHYKKTSCHFPHSVNIERQKNYMVTGPQNHDCNGCIASTYLYIFFGSFQHQHQSIPCLAYLHTIILSI